MSARISISSSWLNALACSSTSVPNPTEKSRGTAMPGQPRLHGLDGLAQRHLDLGADARDALLVLPLDLDRARSASGRRIRFLAWMTWPWPALSITSSTSSTRLAVLLAQADDDRVLVAALPELRGRSCRRRSCAACWPRRSGAGRAAPPSARSTRTASSGRPSSRPMRAPAMPGVWSISALARMARAAGVLEVVAADLEREAPLAAAR